LSWHEEHKKAEDAGRLRSKVVALIRDLEEFRVERRRLELAARGTTRAIPVGLESVRLFQKRFSSRLHELSSELPQYLESDGRQLKDVAEVPIGADSSFLDSLLQVLRDVTSSL
jgi:hypothetical protein